jgi:glyoxylase-like metal-dependent hydrolase (beta-lactamase superfamily II)
MREKIKIHALRCGEVLVDKAVPFGNVSKNPWAYTGAVRAKRHKIWLPVFTYLIEHPKGNILVDTSWSREVRDNPAKALGFAIHFASKPSLPAGEFVAEQLERLDVAPSDLEYVFLTHLDGDHIAGLKGVADAKTILTNEEELKNVGRNPRYNAKMWEGVNLQGVRLSKSKYGPFKRSYDVFGDGSVLLVWLPGHSEGMTGVLVQNNSRFVLLTGDCGYAARSWQELALPGIMSDKQKMLKSLGWVKAMSERENCVEVLASHDREVKPHTIAL